MATTNGVKPTNIEVMLLFDGSGAMPTTGDLDGLKLGTLAGLSFGLLILIDDPSDDSDDDDFSLTEYVREVATELSKHAGRHLLEFGAAHRADVVTLRVSQRGWVNYSYGPGCGNFQLRQAECDWCHPD